MLFRKSLSSSHVPDDWKQARVTPIFKNKGSKHEPSNYRPVSLTSVVCKVLERIVTDNLFQHLETENLLSPDQYGFRKGRSCASQLLKVVEEWTDILEDKAALDVVFFDFEKAFDTVSHPKLINKLKSVGASTEVVNWTVNHLSKRQQTVIVNGEESSPITVTSGVPQGSVYGPVLFLVFINDLPDVITNPVKMFADDTKIYRRVDTQADCQSLQDDINGMQGWSGESQMRFHPLKCKVLRIGNEHPTFQYEMTDRNGNVVPLEFVRCEKDIGVCMDNKLSFTDQVSEVTSKGLRTVGLIRRKFETLDKQMFLDLFKSQARPIVESSNLVWTPSTKRDQIELEKVQRRASSYVSGLQHLDYENRMRALGLPSLAYRRRRGDMIEMYKRVNGCYDEEFPWVKIDSNPKGLRGTQFKLVKERKTNAAKRNAFSVRAVNDWLSLPDQVVNAPSVNAFKARIDRHWDEFKYVYPEYGSA